MFIRIGLGIDLFPVEGAKVAKEKHLALWQEREPPEKPRTGKGQGPMVQIDELMSC